MGNGIEHFFERVGLWLNDERRSFRYWWPREKRFLFKFVMVAFLVGMFAGAGLSDFKGLPLTEGHHVILPTDLAVILISLLGNSLLTAARRFLGGVSAKMERRYEVV